MAKYRDAIEWLANYDDSDVIEAYIQEESGAFPSISMSLVASLFNKTIEEVVADVLKEVERRDKEKALSPKQLAAKWRNSLNSQIKEITEITDELVAVLGFNEQFQDKTTEQKLEYLASCAGYLKTSQGDKVATICSEMKAKLEGLKFDLSGEVKPLSKPGL